MAYFYHLEDGRRALSRCIPIDILDNERTEMQILDAAEDTENASYIAVAVLCCESVILLMTFAFVCMRFFKRDRMIPVNRRVSRAIDIDLSMLEGTSFIKKFKLVSVFWKK